MKRQWHDACRRFAALARRERLLLGAAGIASILLLGYTYAVEPLLIQRQKDLQQIALHQDEARRIGEQAALLARQAGDPDRELRAQLARSKEAFGSLDAQVRELDRLLIRPQAMDQVLAELLQRRPGLRVLALQTQAGQALEDGAAADGKVEGLYRHAIVVQLEGSYAELTDFVAELEARPLRLFRQRAQLASDGDGKCRLSLELFTLGLERSWLTL